MGAWAVNAPSPLTIPTPDATGQNVEPCVLHVPGGWNGYAYWMATSGYFHADSQQENPSILCSNDGTTWAVPAGLTNPLDPAPGAPATNADQSIFLDSGNKMWLVWRRDDGAGTITIYARSSVDGASWTPKVAIYSVAQATFSPAGPTVVYWKGAYQMWWADAQHLGPASWYTQTAASPLAPWSAPLAVTAPVPSGWAVWEANIIVGGPGLVGVTTLRNIVSGFTELHYLTSGDGLTWVVSTNPVCIQGGSGAWDHGQWYRSAIAPINDKKFDLWYSAQDGSNNWFTGRTTLVLV